MLHERTSWAFCGSFSVTNCLHGTGIATGTVDIDDYNDNDGTVMTFGKWELGGTYYYYYYYELMLGMRWEMDICLAFNFIVFFVVFLHMRIALLFFILLLNSLFPISFFNLGLHHTDTFLV